MYFYQFPHLDPCAQLWCGEGPRVYSCKTKNVVSLDGSQCGHTDQVYLFLTACLITCLTK